GKRRVPKSLSSPLRPCPARACESLKADMPELPEIETICCGLKPHLEGRRILSVNVVERRLRCLVDRRLAERLKGKTILQIGRRAKYILISLSCDMVWMIHLGMSGKLIRVDPRTPKQKHDHIVVSLASGLELRYP